MFSIIKKYKYVFDFLQAKPAYPFYKGLLTKSGIHYFNHEDGSKDEVLNNKVHVVNYIPPFIKPILNKDKGLKVISFVQFNGFMAKMDGYNNIEEYLKSNMSSKNRSKMRSYVRKLEACFDISYKFYYGNISRNKYNFLFLKFRSFIVQRFQQRGDTHELLAHWNFIRESSYKMIMEKRASLFVIYNSEEPIDICLNYHFGDLVHNGIRSYDIDYSKFRLGYIDIYKQLDWCFNHDMRIFDLGLGDMAYKRMWCDVVYDFEHQIIYDKTSTIKDILAKGLFYYFIWKESMKKKKVYKAYQWILKLGRNPVKRIDKYEETKFKSFYLDIPLDLSEVALVNIKNTTYTFLKKPVYDFQYLNLDTTNDISVYKSKIKQNIFYIVGKKKIKQIHLISR